MHHTNITNIRENVLRDLYKKGAKLEDSKNSNPISNTKRTLLLILLHVACCMCVLHYCHNEVNCTVSSIILSMSSPVPSHMRKPSSTRDTLRAEFLNLYALLAKHSRVKKRIQI